ncbi:(Fe-S)-binding protein [Bacillus tianshenii]|nr:(Fe-S)-binding protein [Bacillus tianshenii]
MTDLKELQEKINYHKTFDCVQCGYCLPACPTYETMQKETHSPRGRINLVKMAAEGKVDVEKIREPIDLCLGCRACETVCPTGVEYGQILEGAKEVLEEHDAKSPVQKGTERMIFKEMFPSRKWMNTIGNASWFYQKSGLQKVLQKTGVMKLAPLNLDKFETVLPDLPSPKQRKTMQHHYPASGQKKAKVGVVLGCVMDAVFHRTNRNTIELLRRSGAEIIIPKKQTCCGALHAHAGKVDETKEMAKQNIQAFEEADVDYIVNNAGGCGAMLNEYHLLFEGDPEWSERAKRFTAKSKDISVVLSELNGLTFTRELDEQVTYQSSCHMINVQKVTEEPLRLIKSIPGVRYKPMDSPDRCCGSAGIYNIVNYDESMKILDLKMDDAKQTNAATIVTTNPGCLLQMKLGIEREGLQDRVRAVHLVDLLMEAGPESKERIQQTT